MREKGAPKEKDRSNEVDSLFSVFSTSGGIGRLSGRSLFSRFAPFYVKPRALPSRSGPSAVRLSLLRAA